MRLHVKTARPITATIITASALAALSLGVASAGRSDADTVLAGYEKTGATTNCIRLSMLRDSDPLDDFAILFEVKGGAVYLNELNGRCTGLERERRFSYRTPQAQICEGDIISVTDNFGTFRGSCSLGEFQELSPIPIETASN